ncbi:MAG: hypothetical protein H7328_03020 [Bdellovibrio sp.]|nr:hypothetical protein [Bdellovibrio sp.]
MKKKLYHFSGETDLESNAEIKNFLNEIEVIPFENLSAQEVLNKNFDIIELKENDYDQFKNIISAVGWKISHLNSADALLRDGKIYRPTNVVADCILHLIQQRQSSISTAAAVMVIGDYNFVLSVTAKLALAGFKNFVISFEDESLFAALQKRLKDFIFNLNLTFVKLNELNQVPNTSSMLISNMTENMSPEAYESLAYFNFLSHDGIFVDASSAKNGALIEEARRAELTVIVENEILTLKYKTLLELSKNSSKV